MIVEEQCSACGKQLAGVMLLQECKAVFSSLKCGHCKRFEAAVGLLQQSSKSTLNECLRQVEKLQILRTNDLQMFSITVSNRLNLYSTENIFEPFRI